MISNLVVILGIGVVPSNYIEDTVPLVEISSVYNRDMGNLRFTQLIFWDQQHQSYCYHVRSWIMTDRLLNVYKEKDYYVIVVRRKDLDIPMRVKALRLKRTYTFDDSEELDRKGFPLEARIPIEGLR